MQVAPEAINPRVSSASAARCRYVKSVCRGSSSDTSSGWGSLTPTISSAAPNTSAAPATICAPCAEKSSSRIAEPSPAPLCTTTSCPLSTSSRTPAGVNATRYSSVLTSVGSPTFKRSIPPRRPRTSTSPAQVGCPIRAVVHVHPMTRLFEHRAQDLLDLLELLGTRDQRRRELDHGVAAVIGPADEAAPVELTGEEAPQQRL